MNIASERMQHYLLQSMRMVIWLVGLSLVQPFAALAQTNTSMPLPPEAQEAVDKGIIAAKVPDYLLAIRFFEDARKLAPDAPVIYLNLGLAESKIPGRELRAMAWFGAYLADYPDAPNAAAVKEQIAVLDVRNQSNLSRLIASLQEAALQKILSEPGSIRGPGEQNDAFLYDTVKLWIEVGDIAAAQKTLHLFNDPNPGSIFSSKSHTLRDIAIAQARGGDITTAKKTVEQIQDERGRTQVLQSIAMLQAESGDIAGAKNTADFIEGDWEKSWAQSAIAKQQATAGDIAGAHVTYMASLETADLVLAAGARAQIQAQIANSQIDANDMAGAQATLMKAKQTAVHTNDENKEYAEKVIAEVQAKLNIASSLQAKPPAQSEAQTEIAVADWLKALDDQDENNEIPLNTDPFLDLTGYLNTLPARWAIRYPGAPPVEGHPEQFFMMVHSTAEKVVKAHKVITAMLKQGAAK